MILAFIEIPSWPAEPVGEVLVFVNVIGNVQECPDQLTSAV